MRGNHSPSRALIPANVLRRVFIMTRTLSAARPSWSKPSWVLALLTMSLAMPLLAGCNTTAGAGQDISATGHAVTKAATSATP
jgi:predicted small secreted protein